VGVRVGRRGGGRVGGMRGRGGWGAAGDLAGELHLRPRRTPAFHSTETEDGMNLTTIIIILVILAVLGGGWGYTRRGRL
jgi:hypothetical protein